MDFVGEAASLVLRQSTGNDGTISVPIEGTAGHCGGGNDYDGRIGVRISAIFVIWFGSTLGAWFPVFARRHAGLAVPEWTFFIAKFFGSGVIVATAFIHLLAPANEALTDPCLTGGITEYSWVEGIALITIFILFFLELMTMRFGKFSGDEEHDHSHGHSHGHSHSRSSPPLSDAGSDTKKEQEGDGIGPVSNYAPGRDHLGHQRQHQENELTGPSWEQRGPLSESYSAQMTAIFILEFGVIFHSVFIGLTLAVSGSEFNTLYVVLVFHQTFEGLGLGARLSAVPWPKSKKWTPYLLALAYGISTSLAIAIGLGVRKTYPPGSATTLIVNGVFDSISAGILIYTGLVELMAHEFMFSPEMQRASIKKLLSAFGLMCLGAGLMALLGKWA